jgi:hypothetical protein
MKLPNKPAAGKAGTKRPLTIGYHWPGLPEPGRSALVPVLSRFKQQCRAK